MKLTPKRLQALERLLAGSDSEPFAEHDEESRRQLEEWAEGGCRGELPSAGRAPWKYTEEEWNGVHRSLIGLVLQERGLTLPADYSEQERRQVKDIRELFARIDPSRILSLRQMGRLAPYRDVIERWMKGGGESRPGSQEKERQEVPII